MSKVTIPKKEYQSLKKQANAYRKFATRFFEVILKDPVADVVEDFRKTDLYSDDFLKDLESGLRKSSYAKRHAH